MPVREVAFELECFEWADERLEVAGRWKGLAGRRLNRPVLTVETEGGRRKHLVAMPGGHFGSAEESWRAAFDWPGDPAEITGAELEVGGKIVVDLPLPDRKRRRRRRHAQDTGDELLRSEIAALRGQVERLRSELAGRERENMQLREQIDEEDDGEPLVSEAGAATVEIAPPAPQEDLTAELERLAAERDQTRAELSAELERLHRERDRMRIEIERLEGEKNHAQADVDDLREAFAEAAAEAEEVRDRHRAEVAALHEELRAERATVARLTAELAAGPEIPPPRTPSGRRRAPWAVVQRPDEEDRPVDEDRFAAAFAGDDRLGDEDADAAFASEAGDAGAAEPDAAAVADDTEGVEAPAAADGGIEEADERPGESAGAAVADDTERVEPPAGADGGIEGGDERPGEPAAAAEGGDERPREHASEDVAAARNEAARRAAAAAPPTQPLTPVSASDDDSLPASASVSDMVDPPGPLRAGARPASQPGVDDGARPSRIPAWLRAGRGGEEERSAGPGFQAIKDRIEGVFASNGHAEAEDETADRYDRVPGPRRSAAAARARAEATVAARRSPAELWALRVLAALLVAVLLIAFLLILTSIA
jgi:hypothetical protein